uniref:Putative movement protein n=1 Tax=Camellia japonica associated betaflexivirus 1 TaxID=2686011 RepID=A0A6B9EJF5_9VIRU|nr:putative movement protein [Camellia japonica associated betaflexivirus 1]
MSKAIKVKSLVQRLEVDRSLLNSNEVSALYGGAFAPLVFKDEVKMVIPGNLLGGPICLQTNILTKSRLEKIRSQKFKGKSCAYLHLGVVTVVIQSLLVSGNERIRGRCSLVDLSRGSEETGLIDRFKFCFTKSEPFAAKMLTINAAIDIDCDVSAGSLQALLEVEGIDIRTERSVLAVTTGITCVPTNSMVMLPGLKRETPKFAIANVYNVSDEDPEEHAAFNSLFSAANPKLIDLGQECILEEGKRFGLWGPVVKPVHRRKLTTRGLIRTHMDQIMSGPGKDLKEEVNLKLSRSSSFRDVCETGKEEAYPRRSFGMAMEEFCGSRKFNGSVVGECSKSKGSAESEPAGAEIKGSSESSKIYFWEHSRSLGRSSNRVPVNQCKLSNSEHSGNRRSCTDGWEFQSENTCRKSEDVSDNESGSAAEHCNIEGGLPELCKLRP